MSKVQRFWCDEARNIRCVREDDFDALEAEAQALREEVASLRMARDDFKLERDLARQNFCDEQAANYQLQAHLKSCLGELAELRARVVVVPGRLGTTTSLGLMDVMTRHHHLGWNACLDELARLNGMTVSEGLVQGMAKFAREIICGALDGGSFDGADIQESAERHGLIAKQVMNEPCRGPEEYCACAWSTSFPAECYRVTPKLRALLNEDKENSNG
ncbi:hypothetical protein O0072_18115 [Pseudomonas aeruginosa]|uniref:hypothetical protein n=1 Tax=Pseudomonas aeruginosa TaxID=287 RepID=UPI00235A3728|nr:hypothetical protein KKY72_06760 [Pseudomonas aeruginosa]